MKLILKSQLNKLLSNSLKASRDDDEDIQPIVKLFTPWGGATWLLSEVDPSDNNIAFGLCDLGHGSPELGYVDLRELQELRGPMGLKVERDMHFYPCKTLSAYSDESRIKGRINA